MMIICAAMEEQNLAHRYSVKSRFLSTANPPATPLELKSKNASERRSQSELAQCRVAIGTASQRPVILAVGFGYG